ncbi:endonuclease domain-containing protein [Phenylobacterium sp.]|uniref:endonuclease domain-containing protein n=1 Tax=Phenylobacterium sp. TaxID=1871053 RepID=UPI0028A13678|nr:endonuclease domain-containing protein [Phenylobacterium sp.]
MEAPERTRRLALSLRKAMTLPEVLLWKALKGRRLDGLHFRKQHPAGPYVLDFYCDSAKLCVEVDGYSHGAGTRPARDEQRDAWLAEQGIRTLRISAELVLQDVDAAIATIRQALES